VVQDHSNVLSGNFELQIASPGRTLHQQYKRLPLQ